MAVCMNEGGSSLVSPQPEAVSLEAEAQLRDLTKPFTVPSYTGCYR